MSITFFKPADTFVDWLIAYAGNRVIVDVGCGTGALLLALKKRGYEGAIGIDLQHHKVIDALEAGVMALPADARGHVLLQGRREKVLCVFARPCHSQWIRECIEQAAPGVEALVITHPINEGDLKGLEWQRIEDAACVAPGDSGEVVYRVRRDTGYEFEAYTLVNLHGYGTQWRRRDGDRWLGCWSDTWCSVSDSDQIIREIVTNDPDALPMYETDAWKMLLKEQSATVKKDQACGYISPSGMFFRCRYHEHETYASMVLGFSRTALTGGGFSGPEKHGKCWIAVHPASMERGDEGAWWHNEEFMCTMQQLATLRALRIDRYELDDDHAYKEGQEPLYLDDSPASQALLEITRHSYLDYADFKVRAPEPLTEAPESTPLPEIVEPPKRPTGEPAV